MPRPAGLVVKKGSNKRDSVAGGIPGPLSSTISIASPYRGSSVTRTSMRPRLPSSVGPSRSRMASRAFRTRLMTICCRRLGSPSTIGPGDGRSMSKSMRAALSCSRSRSPLTRAASARSNGRESSVGLRATVRRSRTMPEARSVCPVMRSSFCLTISRDASGSPAASGLSSSSRRESAASRITASGWLIS